MNELQYTVTLEDLVDWNEYHYRHSPTLQRADRIQRFGTAGFILLFGLVQSVHEGTMPVFVFWVALASAFVVIWPPWRRRGIRKQVAQAYEEGLNRSYIGDIRLRLEPDVLVMLTEVSELKMKWEGVERIEETPDYVFIYTSAVSSVVIPKRGIIAGNCDEFVEEMRKRLRTSAA